MSYELFEESYCILKRLVKKYRICTLQGPRLLQDDHMLRALASLIWKSL